MPHGPINSGFNEWKGTFVSEDHKPLPVHGYTAQPDAKVALVNEFKQDEERLLRKLDTFATTRNIPVSAEDMRNNTISMPTVSSWATEIDQRWLAIARTKFEEAYMALNRAVFQPKRVQLPEDDK